MLGISVLNYALAGIQIMESNRWWWLMIINLLIIGAGSMLPGIAFMGHMYGFAVGCVIGILYRIFLTPRYE